MKCSIIIPAYNCHDTIDRALASVAMQKLDSDDALSVYIVDDCSPDGEYDDCAMYWAVQMDVSVIRKKENFGCGQARQTGLDHCDGEMVMFLDADDTFASPFAVRTLMRVMKANPECNMAMGMFIEETPSGSFITHEINYIWCHGKMYRKSFLDEHKLRFNFTRGSEDAGFHAVLSKLTDKVLYVPQVVYMWEHRPTSLVRTDDQDYRLNSGWREFVENMAWAAEQMEERGVKEEDILPFIYIVLARLYWQYAESLVEFPGHAEENLEKLRDFYDRAVKPHEQEMDDAALGEAWLSLTKEDPPRVVPPWSFNDFLQSIAR